MGICVNIKSYYHKDEQDVFFNDIQFDVEQNGFYLIAGESGIGKTTLLKILLGINDGKLDGSVKYNEKFSPIDFRKTGRFGYQSDEFNLIPWITIKENILLPKLLNKNVVKHISDDDLIKSMNDVGLFIDVKDKYPDELSYGMSARVSLVRATIYHPEIVFLDEFLSGIDRKNIQRLKKYLIGFKSKAIIIVISHQIDSIIDIVDSVFHINEKRKLEVHTSQSYKLLINKS